MNSSKISNNLILESNNSFFEEQIKAINELDNTYEPKFQNRQDLTLNKEKKILKNAKIYFEFEEDNKQKQIKRIFSIIEKNYKKNKKENNIFKPLLKPKIISMKNKIFYNNNNEKNLKNNNFNNNNNKLKENNNDNNDIVNNIIKY